MRNDVIDRSAVVPAITQTLNTIMQDMQMYSIPMESKDERLRRYGEALGRAIERVPSAGTNEITVPLEDVGAVCGALARAGYVVTADKSGAISYEREVGA